MQGSKYDDETREKALALCAAPKMNPAKAAKELGIPRATVYDWWRTAKENDPDVIAVRRNKIRSMMDKAYAVVGRSMDGLEKQSKAIRLEKAEVDRVILRILSSPQVDEDTAEKMVKIVREYTGTSMTDMVKVMRETMDLHERLEGKLTPGGGDTVIQISFDDGGLGSAAE